MATPSSSSATPNSSTPPSSSTSPWIIRKTLTNEDIRGQFPIEQGQIRDILLMRGVSEQDIVNVFRINVRVKDLDTNSLHDVQLWKYQFEDSFSMKEDWIEVFVNRRRLVAGTVVDMYWDYQASFFCFSVRSSPTGKQAWPELVGKDVVHAVSVIRRENRSLKIKMVPRQSVVTVDNKWVVVYYDENNKVTSTPKTLNAMD